MSGIVTTNKKYRPGVITTETIVDGDVWKVVEEYTDDDGQVVYVREYDYSPATLMRRSKEKDQKKNFKGKRR